MVRSPWHPSQPPNRNRGGAGAQTGTSTLKRTTLRARSLCAGRAFDHGRTPGARGSTRLHGDACEGQGVQTHLLTLGPDGLARSQDETRAQAWKKDASSSKKAAPLHEHFPQTGSNRQLFPFMALLGVRCCVESSCIKFQT